MKFIGTGIQKGTATGEKQEYRQGQQQTANQKSGTFMKYLLIN